MVTTRATDGTALAGALRELAPQVLAHINANHDDSLLLVGRFLGGHPEATSCRAVGLDATGVELRLQGPEGKHVVRIPFEEPVTDPMQITLHAVALVLEARAVSGEEGLTSIERDAMERTRIRTFVTSVKAVVDVHPHLRRITFAGGDLLDFAPSGPDSFVYVLLPPPGRHELTIDQSFTWEGYQAMPEEERPVGAYYTVRSWWPRVGEMDVLFVVHGDEGPASAWAQRAQPGDPVALWGPRTSFEPPPDTAWYLLVADETGLPATAAILEQLPSGVPAIIVAEAASPEERQELPDRPGTEVHWRYRHGAPAGTTDVLLDAVTKLRWPDGPGYVWGGGESRTLSGIRRHVRQLRGMPRERVSLVGYWRHASSPPEVDEDEPVDATR